MKMNNQWKRTLEMGSMGALCLLTAASLVGCSQATTALSGLQLSGTVTNAAVTSGTSSLFGEDSFLDFSRNSTKALDFSHHGIIGHRRTVDLTSSKVVCTTQDGTSTTTSASIGSNGKFSMNVTGGTDTPLTCIIEDQSGNQIGTFILQDSSQKDMNGNSLTTDQFKGSSSVDLGTASYDPTTNEATVNVSEAIGLSSTVASASQAFDPTGTWVVGSVSKLDPGFVDPCATQGNNCNGPVQGMSLYLNRLVGTSTSDGSTVYGLQLWMSQSAMNACGNMTGLSTDQATAAGVSITSGGTPGAFTFTTTNLSYNSPANQSPITGDSLTNGYQLSSAATLYPMQSGCGPQSVTVSGITYNAYVCHDAVDGVYMVNLSGGCVDGNSNPVNVTDWSGITCPSQQLDPSTGYYTQSCSGTSGGTAVTCTNIYGFFSDANLSVQTNTNFNWANIGQINAGTACSTLSAGDQALVQAQCYAQWYQQGLGNSMNASYCLPKVNTNWTASTVSDFISIDFRPTSMIFMDKLTYQTAANGVTTGTLRTSQDYYNGVPVKTGSNQTWIPCKVHEVDTLKLTYIDATHLRATYVSNMFTVDIAKPACVAAFGDANSNTSKKFQFKITKQ